MTESILNEYISRVKHSSDGDAFHSLIEAGEEAVTPVIRAINTECSVDQFKRLIEVLQEIRTMSALGELRQLCLMDFSKKNLEHCGTLHVPFKYAGLYRKRIKLTKVAIVFDVKFNF